MLQNLQRKSWLWVWFFVLIILVLFFLRVYTDSQRLRPATPEYGTPIGEVLNLSVSPLDPSLGSATAGLVLIELADFECPYCAEASPILEQFVRDHSNQVRLIWKDFIIPSHANSLSAAIAAQCAGRQGKFWEYQQQLFLNQNAISSELFLSLADSLGLNSTTFNNCINNQETLPLIEFNQKQIANLGLLETPTLFVNGQIYTGDITGEALINLLP